MASDNAPDSGVPDSGVPDSGLPAQTGEAPGTRNQVRGLSPRAALPVCLVAYNPLAAHQLRERLTSHPGVQLIPYEDVLRSKRAAKQVAVFLLDRGSLPMPLSKFLRILRMRVPGARILVLDDPQPRPELLRLFFLGIQGSLPYGEVEPSLLPALRAVADGHLWGPAEVLAQYAGYSAQFARSRLAHADPLSRRERRVVELVRRRLSNGEIASILGADETAVKTALANVFAKLGVSDRESVAELASSDTLGKLLLQKFK